MAMLTDEDGNEVEVPDNFRELAEKLEAANKEAKEHRQRAEKAEKALAPILAERRERLIVDAAKEASAPDWLVNAWKERAGSADVEPSAEEFTNYAASIGFPLDSQTSSAPVQEPAAQPAQAATVTSYQPPSEARVTSPEAKEEWGAFMARFNNPQTHDQAMRDFDEGRVQVTGDKR